MSLCGSTTSEYRIRFLVILKSYQFIVQINVFGEMLAYCCDTETTYQSFLWFYTSLRDHYNSGGKQSYSTLLYSIFFHHVEASCGPRARSPSANINFLQPQACSGLIFYSNTRGYVNNSKISILSN